MQALLGLALFSVLLTTGASLKCEVCVAMGTTCSSDRLDCSSETCVYLRVDMYTALRNYTQIEKLCTTKAQCQTFKNAIGKVTPLRNSGIIREVECSKAPLSAASLLLILSVFLLGKIFLE